MKISVILTSYNYANYIESAISSILAQTLSDWELLVVDDGSSDNSLEIIKSFCEKDNRIKLFQHENAKNKGLKESILLGVKNATGDWIAFLESDDLLEPENLMQKVQIMEKYPSVKFIFNKVDFIDECNSKKINRFVQTQNELSRVTFPKNMFYDFGIQNKISTFSCVMIEKEILLRANFNTPMDEFLDWWLWIHIAQNNDFYYIDKPLTKWRLHQNSYIKAKKKSQFHFTQLKAYLDIYKKNPKNFKLLFFIICAFFKSIFYKLYTFVTKCLS